jgi:hypothetical protein
MSLFCRLSGRHYWCIPHRSADNRLIQVCYECGAERQARELHTEPTPEWVFKPTNVSPIKKAKLAPVPVTEPEVPRRASPEPIAVGQAQIRKLALIK